MEEFLPTLIVIVAFAWLAARGLRGHAMEERLWLWVSFAAHQLAGAANVWVARYYYGYGDMISYHNLGLVEADGLRSDFWGIAPSLIKLIFHSADPLPLPIEPLVSSSGTMQGIAGFCAYFLFDSLHAACALVAGIAFFSKISLYSVAREEFPQLPRRSLLVITTLIPSVVFWTSSLLKEPIAMAALLFALRAWKDLLAQRRSLLHSGSVLGASLGAILLVKGYLIPPLALSAGVWYLLRRAREQNEDIVLRLWHVLVAMFGATVLIAVVGAFLPSFAVEALNTQLATNQAAGQSVEGGSNYSLGAAAGSGSAASQLALAPLALLTALFRPALFEAKNALMLANALELTAFAVAFVWVPFRRGLTGSFAELSKQPFLSFCAVFVALFGTFTGLGSTNLGTLSRYRAPLVPFFAILLLALLTKSRQPAHVTVVNRPQRQSRARPALEALD